MHALVRRGASRRKTRQHWRRELSVVIWSWCGRGAVASLLAATVSAMGLSIVRCL